jgi:hypothetical protein
MGGNIVATLLDGSALGVPFEIAALIERFFIRSEYVSFEREGQIQHGFSDQGWLEHTSDTIAMVCTLRLVSSALYEATLPVFGHILGTLPFNLIRLSLQELRVIAESPKLQPHIRCISISQDVFATAKSLGIETTRYTRNEVKDRMKSYLKPFFRQFKNTDPRGFPLGMLDVVFRCCERQAQLQDHDEDIRVLADVLRLLPNIRSIKVGYYESYDKVHKWIFRELDWESKTNLSQNFIRAKPIIAWPDFRNSSYILSRVLEALEQSEARITCLIHEHQLDAEPSSQHEAIPLQSLQPQGCLRYLMEVHWVVDQRLFEDESLEGIEIGSEVITALLQAAPALRRLKFTGRDFVVLTNHERLLSFRPLALKELELEAVHISPDFLAQLTSPLLRRLRFDRECCLVDTSEGIPYGGQSWIHFLDEFTATHDLSSLEIYRPRFCKPVRSDDVDHTPVALIGSRVGEFTFMPYPADDEDWKCATSSVLYKRGIRVTDERYDCSILRD